MKASNRLLKLLRFFGVPSASSLSADEAWKERAAIFADPANKERWNKYVYLTHDVGSESPELKPFDPVAIETVTLPPGLERGAGRTRVPGAGGSKDFGVGVLQRKVFRNPQWNPQWKFRTRRCAMGAEENKALVRRLQEAWDKGNLDVLDELLAPNFVDHNPMPGLPADRAGQKQRMTLFRAAFPDLKTTVEDLVAEGDKVVLRGTARGTHKGEFQGMAPTGKQVAVQGIFIGRVVGGKLVETWEQFDAMGLMQQLGAMPSPGRPTGR